MTQPIPDDATIAADRCSFVMINTMPPRDPDQVDEDELEQELEEELEEEKEEDGADEPVVREPDDE
jgi:hypothetical protein